jgi:hypothetical protein
MQLVFYSNILAITALLTFLSQNIVLLTILGLVLILIAAILLRIGLLEKKKSKHEVVRPVTEFLGSSAERLAELNRELKPFGFSYEPYQDIFYSLMYPWQRELGYCRLYDEASVAMSMIIDCEPIRFEYGGRRWLIEFWKGQYGMTTGGEVGIYYTTRPDLNIPGLFNGPFYFCARDEDCINMSFIFKKKGNILFTRSGYHWWLTGFKLGEFSKPSELTMDITLDLYDRKMANAFVDGLKRVGYKPDEYIQEGNRVIVRFAKPHTKQPLTRSALTEFIMQRNNQAFCEAYQYLTEAYPDTLDKLEIVRQEAPSMYNQILRLGKPKAVFEAYNKLKDYLMKDDTW